MGVIMFDRIFLINLERRPDRLESFRQKQKQYGWGLSYPTILKAIDGQTLTPPPHFTSGKGAWGCLLSHCGALGRALHERSVLILEDDIIWQETAWKRLEDFMANVPKDWDMLMLGGQHRQPSTEVCDGVVQVTDCHRTHAYALRGEAIASMLEVFAVATEHIDLTIANWQKNHKVYAPVPFIFGQAAGKSDIGADMTVEQYWPAISGGLRPGRPAEWPPKPNPPPDPAFRHRKRPEKL